MGAQVGIFDKWSAGGGAYYGQDLYYTPEQFGAVGDGIANDTVAVQACVTAGRIDGKEVRFLSSSSYAISLINVWWKQKINGQWCRIYPIGNPAQIFLITCPTPAVAGEEYYSNIIKNFYVYDDCQNFIQVVGGPIYHFEFSGIHHIEGVVSNAIIRMYNDSATHAPGVGKIFDIESYPIDPATSNSKYILEFDKAGGAQNFDDMTIYNLSLASNVTGARVIYLNPAQAPYLAMSSIKNLLLSSTPVAGYACILDINAGGAGLDRSIVENLYLETDCANSKCVEGVAGQCTFDVIGVYTGTAALAGLAALNLFARSSYIRNFWINRAGTYPYDTGYYPAITFADAAGENFIETDRITAHYKLEANGLHYYYQDEIVQLANGDATPSTYWGDVFATNNAGATTITSFAGGVAGHKIILLFNDNNTTIDFTGTILIGHGGVDWTPQTNDRLEAIFDGTNWICDCVET